MKVAFIGIGAIGAPMAERLLLEHDVTVFDLNTERVAEFVDKGAAAAQSAAAATIGAEVTIVMVATPQQLRSVLFDGGVADALGVDSTLAIMSSVGVDAVQEAGEYLSARGVRVVDAPVTGGVVRAITGELTLLLGGDEQHIQDIASVLHLLGTRLARCGARVGDGQAVKVVNQLLCSVHLAVAGEALTLARGLGLDPAAVLDIVGSGAAGSFMLNDRGPRMLQDDAPVLSAIDIFVKDSHLVQEAARASDSITPILDAAAERFEAAQRDGLGRSDDSTVIRTFGAGVRS